TFHGLPASVITTFQDPTSPLYDHCHVVREAGARLLDRAVRDGVVRGDVSIIDVLTNATGIAWATERGPYDSTRAERLIRVMMDGLKKVK
ncbi:MAG TPA: TetR/AcrR family transcriptional regulator, partial [Pseudonocardiaceae bacterium]